MNPQARPRTLRVVRSTDEGLPAPESDDALLDAFSCGDPDFGDRLYRHLIGVVESTLYRILGQRGTDHEDLVQSAFEQIVVTLSNGRFARSCSLKSWAAAITSHLAFNALRARTTERKVIHHPSETNPIDVACRRSDPERDSSIRRKLDQLRILLGQMSPKLAQTLILHDAMGHELSEIALLTGVSVAAAQSRLVRGRKALERLAADSGLREDS